VCLMPLIPAQHEFRRKAVLIRGKLKRFYAGHFRKCHVARRLATREGSCRRCGACCELLFRCAFATRENGLAACRIYGIRPINCRIFPMSPQDLAERNLILPDRPCGYYFKMKDSKSAPSAGPKHGR
jgi:hypothetical protein